MTKVSDIFGGQFTPPKQKERYTEAPDRQLIDEIAGHGYEPPSNIIFDGKIHRFSTNGKKGDQSGWYVAYEGKICAGAFGCWKDGTAINWRQDLGRELSLSEQLEHAERMKAVKAAREKEQAERQSMTADTVTAIWSNATEASDDHPYLKNKKVKSHGLKVTGDGRLIIPMFDGNGELTSLQYINADGSKKYHQGGKVAGSVYSIVGSGEVFLVEGYATAATVHEITGATVFIAFSANQLPVAATVVKRLYPDATITVFADNDESGTGQREGRKAAEAINARLIMPPDVGTDANDFYQAGGDLVALINPPVDDWLISADEFSQQPSPIRWLIKGYLQREALIMVHGPSGGGKTFAVLDMACCIAGGLDQWCGNKVHAGAVVYLAGEGHNGLRGRLAAWKQHNRVDRLDMWLSRAGTDLNTPEGYDRVRRSLLALPSAPSLIIVDTLHRFLKGDENSAQDTKTMLDACAGLMAEFNCSVLLVHHTGVSDEAQHRARGSSAWRGALEIELSVSPRTDTEPMQIIPRKSKDSELPKVVCGRLCSVQLPWLDEDNEAVTSAIFDHDEAAIPTKKEPEQVTNARRSFEAAFIKYGEIDSECRAILSESAWRESYRVEHYDKKPETVSRQFRRAKKSLIEHCFIEQFSESNLAVLGVENTAILALLKGGADK